MGVGAAVSFLGVVVTGYGLWENQCLEVSQYELTTDKIGRTKYRIVQLSDLHIRRFTKKEQRIINRVRELAPDLLVITGDLVDKTQYNEEACLQFIRGIDDLCPTYFIAGNHEMQSGCFSQLEQALASTKVQLLKNTGSYISIDQSNLYLAGYHGEYPASFDLAQKVNQMDRMMSKLSRGISEESFNILLAHKPEFADVYGKYPWDLILSGHTHGGQIAIPGYGAFFTPHQRFFPKYDRGLMNLNQGKLIISRGLGTSLLPMRIGSKPEIVVLEITGKSNHE